MAEIDRGVQGARESGRAERSNPIELNIGELVLHGFPERHREAIGAALQRELGRLLEGRLREQHNMRGIEIDGGIFKMRPGMEPDDIGREIALAIYRGMKV